MIRFHPGISIVFQVSMTMEHTKNVSDALSKMGEVTVEFQNITIYQMSVL